MPTSQAATPNGDLQTGRVRPPFDAGNVVGRPADRVLCNPAAVAAKKPLEAAFVVVNHLEYARTAAAVE